MNEITAAIKTKSMQDNNLYKQVEFEEEFDLISNIGDKFIYLKKVEEDQQELLFREIQIYLRDYINDKYDHRIPDEVFKELSSKYTLIPKH